MQATISVLIPSDVLTSKDEIHTWIFVASLCLTRPSFSSYSFLPMLLSASFTKFFATWAITNRWYQWIYGINVIEAIKKVLQSSSSSKKKTRVFDLVLGYLNNHKQTISMHRWCQWYGGKGQYIAVNLNREEKEQNLSPSSWLPEQWQTDGTHAMKAMAVY